MEYKVIDVAGETLPLAELERWVREAIAEGWRPLGGVSVIGGKEWAGAVQAMTREEA